MNENDKLGELIFSLTKSEKRYFKLYSQRHVIGENNKYVQLFDTIDKQNQYDEVKIKSKFKGDPMLNNFSVTKNRLYNYITSSLILFHTESSVTAKLNDHLNLIEILFRKGLYDLAQSKVKKAKKLAEENEKSSYLLMIIQWESKLLTLDRSKNKKEKINNVTSEEENLIDFLKSKHTIQSIKKQLLDIQGDNKKLHQELISDSISKLDLIDEKALNVSLQQEQKSTLALANFIDGNTHEAIENLKEKLNLFLLHEDKIQKNPANFMSDLANLIHLESSQKDFNAAHEHLAILKSFPEKYNIKITKNFEAKFFSTLNSLQLSYWMQQKQFNKIADHQEEIISELERLGERLPEMRHAYFRYMLAIGFFYSEDYKNALKQANYISNQIADDANREIAMYNRWLQIFIHFELEHFDLVAHLSQTHRKYLSKRGNDNAADKEILSALAKCQKCKNKIDLSEHLEVHLLKLEKIEEKPNLNFSKAYFDYNSWVESKIKGLTLRELLKRA